MRICRAQVADGIVYGVLEGDKLLCLKGSPFDGIRYDGREYPLADVRLLAPTEPSKVVAIGKNYAAHAAEMGGEAPAAPLIFMKPSTAVIGPEDVIEYPTLSKRVDYEGELAVVIGKRCRNVTEENWRDVVLGFTCLNDVTARDLQKADGQWTRGKGFDTFCPIGPWIETEFDPFHANVMSRLNGEEKQNSNTELLMHPIPKLIAYITAAMTLLPGDVIATGTPEGIGPMKVGDTVEVEVKGIGILRNHVKEASFHE